MLKPMFVVKPKTISRRDIKRAQEQCGICIIECSDPDSARYSEPPIMADIDEQSRAAYSLLRMIVTTGTSSTSFYKGDLIKFFVNSLLNDKRPVETTPVRKSSAPKA
jgi:hypothetical protein